MSEPPILQPKAAYALAVVAGTMNALAVPGYDLWPLSFVAWVPLIVALRGQSPQRSAKLGWLAGFSFCVMGFYWLRNVLIVFAEMPEPVPSLLMVVLCAYQAGRLALCGWLHGRLTERGLPHLPVFAGAFVVAELVYPQLFPWYFGNNTYVALPLMQVAELGGPYLTGLVLLAPNLALAEVVHWWRTPKDARPPLPRRAPVMVCLAIPVVAAAYGWVRMGQVEAEQERAESLTVALIQANQPLKKDKGITLDAHWRLSERARDEDDDVDLVVWSEGGVIINIRDDDNAEIKERIGAPIGGPAIIGALIRKKLPKGSRWPRKSTTSAVMTTASGTVTSRYDKRFLLMFGEYLPFGELFPVLYDLSPNSSHLTEGTSLAPLRFGAHRLSTTICYEDIIPSYVNAMMRVHRPDLMVNLTNDAWFGDSLEPIQHLALATMRSVEQRRYLVRSTNSGLSAIVDATGRIVTQGTTFEEDVIHGEARYLTGGTVYRALGDMPWWALALALFGLAFFPREP
ncbi:MAG TPA: apolipoprotein N-acyltransferase [Polyangiaceae bacterium]|nr:apolipoprotein N-acyltransferase [Polyangiaceae bacterium]